MSRRWCVACLAVAACLAAVRGGRADAPEIRAGVGGAWRVGAWTPLVVSWPASDASDGRRVRLAVEDPDGQFVSSPPVPVVADDGGRVTAAAAVRFGRASSRVRVEVDAPGGADGGVIEATAAGEPLPATAGVVLVFGDLPAVNRAMRLVDRERGSVSRVVVVTDTRTTASPPMSFDMAEVMVVCGGIVPSIADEGVAAIDRWVRSGGRLVVLAGESAARLAGPAATWLPGRFDRTVPLRRIGAVEAFARVTGLAERLPPEGLATPRFVDPVGGVVEAAAVEGASSLPLVVRRAHGFGTITWVGLDVDRPPFRDWPGTEPLLFAAIEGREGRAGDTAAAGTPRGGDLAAQLRAALDTFPAQASGRRPRVTSFELVAGLGLLYVLALYPLDWWIASRWASRPWLAWASLPVVAAGFTAAALGLAPTRGLTGLVSSVSAEVVDIDTSTATARGSAWAAVLSGDNDLLDVSVGAPATLVPRAEAAVSWFADAGTGFGGMDAAVAHPSLAAADYGYGDTLAELRRVPIAAGASRLFEARWSGGVDGGLVESTLEGTPQRTLAGGVSHRLPFALERCRLLHAGWLYDVGTLRPGERYDCAAGRGPRSLASALTRRGAVKDRDATARWDASSTDVARILEVAGFHAAAGGPGYTGLFGGRLGRLDLSPLLAVDRAVLVGEADASVRSTAWQLAARGGGAATPDAATPPLVRIVIPVAVEPTP
jgi:hypothetical protein